MIVASTDQQSLRELFAAQVQRHGTQELLVTESGVLTYAELDRMANAAAHLLLDHGVREGSVVMTRCHNGVAIAATWFACIKLGAVFLPLNALLSGRPLLTVMASAGGSLLVCDADLLPAVESIRAEMPQLIHVIVSGRAGPSAFETALERYSTDVPAAPIQNNAAPAKLMFTSGTTGEPKGVVWSRNAEAVHAVSYGAELVRIGAGETAYSCLPLFHATCQGTLLGTMLCGGRIVVDRRFDPFAFWARTRRVNAVFFPYVGTIISVLASRSPRPDDADNPVRRAMGSAAPADRWRQFEERFGLQLEDVWGQTETASCWTRPVPGAVRRGTVGRPTSRWEARLVGSGGREVAAGQTGELLMRAREPHVMFEGYHGEADAAFDGDGWYHTGDLLSREAGGDLVFRGRLRESIRRRGEMVAPAAIEAIAIEHPQVEECAAVGVPADDGVEDEILLCVVPRPESAALDLRTLHAHLRAELPAFMVPRYLRAMAELPKTPTTRVRRHLLREQGAAGAWDSRTVSRHRV